MHLVAGEKSFGAEWHASDVSLGLVSVLPRDFAHASARRRQPANQFLSSPETALGAQGFMT